ncbi:MAG: HNH endonuclease [Bacteroidales bacterium]|nr:HNH endonuclease [Bacteroidales bacterium]
MGKHSFTPHYTAEELASEEWRRCQYPLVRYEVSSLGRIRHARRKQLLRLIDRGNGYLKFNAEIKGKIKSFDVHRQVALCFCEGWRKGLQVNHKDGNKYNNRAENLEWVTASENVRHGRYVLRKQVKAVGLFDGSRLKHLFPTIKEVNLQMGGSVRSHILKHYKYHGYTPRFIPENIYRQTLFNMKVLDMPLRQAYVEAATQIYFDENEERR